jgi:hypothetical protein
MRTLLAWSTVVIVVTIVGLAWEVTAVSVFARRAGGMRGMIASPRPLDYINYDYTPNGRYYAFWAFTVPLRGAGVLLLLAGVTGTFMLSRAGVGKRAIALWASIIACAVIFFAVTAYYYLIATNFFI